MTRILLACLITAGCGAYAPARGPLPPALTRNSELEMLEQAVRWPEPRANTVMLLAGQYLATHREEEGHRYFEERARAAPERPLFLALDGLFQVRMAWRVPLLRRVAWVEDGCRKLERAAAGDGLSRFLRGLVFAELPSRFGRAQTAIADLSWMLEHAGDFPPGLARGAEAGLRHARGDHSGGETLLTDFSVTRAGGFRFGPPRLLEPSPGVFVARGYDFADLAWVTIDGGLVAIDAGTTDVNVRAALVALRRRTTLPIRYVIITHAHWDHIGGLGAMVEPGTQVIAQSRFAEELARINGRAAPFDFFFGSGARGPYPLAPHQVVSHRESLTLGGRRFVLEPARGGETDDALFVQLPDQGIVFVGDAFMPYFGAPFLGEGSPEGIFAAVEELQRMAPQLLLHGHGPLTDNFTIAALPALSESLRGVFDDTTREIAAGNTLPEILAHARMPELLAAHADAVLPFVLMRDNLIKRLYTQTSGYWKSDGEGMEVLTRREWAQAIELAAGDDGLARAAEELSRRGDFAPSLQLAQLGLASHPGDGRLKAAQSAAIDGLRARYQFNPFKFLIYSDLAGRELP